MCFQGGDTSKENLVHWKVALCIAKFFIVIGSASYACIFKIISLTFEEFGVVIKSKTALTSRSLLEFNYVRKNFFVKTDSKKLQFCNFLQICEVCFVSNVSMGELFFRTVSLILIKELNRVICMAIQMYVPV